MYCFPKHKKQEDPTESRKAENKATTSLVLTNDSSHPRKSMYNSALIYAQIEVLTGITGLTGSKLSKLCCLSLLWKHYTISAKQYTVCC